MSALSSLSVELWQTILRYAIGIADFLDPNAFEGIIAQNLITDSKSPRNDETKYWSSEKTRNILQLVCKAWDTYLRQFEHRFVRLLDIRHEKVNPEKLKRAIRVSFGRYNCRCRVYCFPPHSQPIGVVAFATFCWKILAVSDTMEMEIADMMLEEHRVAEFLDSLKHFHNVKTFIGPSCTYSGNFSVLLENLPKLRHFYGKGFWGTREHTKPSRLESENVTTMSFHNRRGGLYSEVAWRLPSLRYLRLKDDSDEPLADFIVNAVLPLLRAIGSQLRSLYLYHRVQEQQQDMPRELWDLCPQLAVLRTGMLLGVPPPFFHPIQTLILCDEKQVDQIQPLPEWPSLRKVIVDQSWGWVEEEKRTSSLEARENVRVEDKDGLTAQEYEQRRVAIAVESES